jgi:hypothetical protein
VGADCVEDLERFSDDGNAQDQTAMTPHESKDDSRNLQPKLVRHYLRG